MDISAPVPGSRPWQEARPEHRVDGAANGLGFRRRGTEPLPIDASRPDARVTTEMAWPAGMRPRQSWGACYVRAATHNPGLRLRSWRCVDPLLDPVRSDAYQMPGYGGRPETTDGQEPLCGELITWRHPTFGNYTDKELAYSFVQADDGHYWRHLFTSFECLTWLLSDNAVWMPQQLRDIILEGMRSMSYGWSTDIMDFTNAFSNALFHRSRSKFRFSEEIRSSVVELFAAALHKRLMPLLPGLPNLVGGGLRRAPMARSSPDRPQCRC